MFNLGLPRLSCKHGGGIVACVSTHCVSQSDISQVSRFSTLALLSHASPRYSRFPCCPHMFLAFLKYPLELTYLPLPMSATLQPGEWDWGVASPMHRTVTRCKVSELTPALTLRCHPNPALSCLEWPRLPLTYDANPTYPSPRSPALPQ